MIEHMVAFTSSTTKEQKNEAIRRLKNLKQEIPGILDIQVSHNFFLRKVRAMDWGLLFD